MSTRPLEAYPLTWPAMQPRVPAYNRTRAAFKVGLGEARDGLLRELRLLGASNVIISSSMATRRDGLPYADAREPHDPGVAVYFDRLIKMKSIPFVIACDTYTLVRFNMRAIGVTVESLRAMKRHGASSLLEQAFTGFAALPAAPIGPPWWQVLGVAQNADRDQIRDAYRELARKHHPDVGGSADLMARINRAYYEAIALRGGTP